MKSARISFRNKTVWIIGAGNQAMVKGQQFIEEGAKVIFVAPSCHEDFPEWLGKSNSLYQNGSYQKKCYEKDDIHCGLLVYACTDNRKLNHQIVLDVNDIGLLSASVHGDEDATYHPLQSADYPHMHVAFSTNGAAPSYNRVLLEEMGASYQAIHHEKLSKLRVDRQAHLESKYSR